MSNFKMGNSKFSRFVNGKGFYIALALCLVAIGSAAYVAVNSSSSLLGSFQNSSSGTSKSTSTSSIPNWDVQSSAKETGKTLNGVEPGKGTTSKATSSYQTPAKAATSSSTTSSKAVSPSAKQKESSTANIVYTYPVANSTGVITAYSADKPVLDKTMNDWRVHDGVDIAAAEGTPVKACASGTVCEVKKDDMYGQEIVIDHGNGIKSIYANLTSRVSVRKGQKVEVGATIGAVGKTATAETAITAHLHFAMTKNGVYIDPLATIGRDN